MFNHPRPQSRRHRWQSLNGTWAFAIDAANRWRLPDEVCWDRAITVPFAPETPASGVGEAGFFDACWYRRTFDDVRSRPEERLFLQFGAVDYEASVWVNGHLVGGHEGGYTPFCLDITDALRPSGEQELVVRAVDDPHDLTRPRGKQDWQLQPHSIWYPRTTGIWQEVWLEPVPPTRIERLRWTPNLERWEIGVECVVEGSATDDLRLHLRLSAGKNLLADDRYQVIAGEVNRRIALSDPGIDDYRNELLWRPDSPTLLNAELTLLDSDGLVLDRVLSYTALRTVGVQGDRFVLNGRPLRLRMVLDQGYWPETGMTPAGTASLRRDVELALAMGFNGVRKHQKLEDPRYLAWADALGLLVWTEMPSVYRFTRRAVERLSSQWMAAIDRDYSHPCIVAWVPFNESWGVPDLPDNPAQRDWVRALYHLTKTLDPSRPVIGNDGWESTATDIIAIHDYDADTERLARRYLGPEVIPNLFRFREALPSGRQVAVAGFNHQGQPLMLTEFGGIAFTGPDRASATWGYHRSDNAEEFAQDFAELLETIRASTVLAGFCYTQFADTYQEANGLLYADRTPKIPLRQIARAVLGHDPEDRDHAPFIDQD